MKLGGVLYISYDGMLEPLGQSQVIAYLKNLASERPIHLISFEKDRDWTNEAERGLIAKGIEESGIRWHPLRYHKRPSLIATSWDILVGVILGLYLVLRYRLNIVHARSYVPSVMALFLKRFTKVKYVFDMRGFWADERVDGGIWPTNGLMYGVGKKFERRFLLAADHIVSLTEGAVIEMRHFDYLKEQILPVSVIPTCADLTRFAPISVNRSNDCFVLGYVGTAGTWYLFDETVKCFVRLLELLPNSRFLIINRGEHDFIRERLAMAGVHDSAVELVTANHKDVPKFMARMNAGVFFIKPVFSKKACAPTKLAEFLGCGIPCLSNTGVGDVAKILECEHVGVSLTAFDEAVVTEALQRLIQLAKDPNTLMRCVAAAHRHFSLNEGVARYRGIYDLLDGT